MNKIRECRIKREISLTQLSKISGLSLGYLSHLERGSRTNPSYNTMKKISNVLGYRISDVFGI